MMEFGSDRIVIPSSLTIWSCLNFLKGKVHAHINQTFLPLQTKCLREYFNFSFKGISPGGRAVRFESLDGHLISTEVSLENVSVLGQAKHPIEVQARTGNIPAQRVTSLSPQRDQLLHATAQQF